MPPDPPMPLRIVLSFDFGSIPPLINRWRESERASNTAQHCWLSDPTVAPCVSANGAHGPSCIAVRSVHAGGLLV